MKKIEVIICQGTACFVMGGNILKSMADTLRARYQDQINVSIVRCLGACERKDSFSKAPFVSVDDDIISEATLEKLVNVIESKLKHE